MKQELIISIKIQKFKYRAKMLTTVRERLVTFEINTSLHDFLANVDEK